MRKMDDIRQYNNTKKSNQSNLSKELKRQLHQQSEQSRRFEIKKYSDQLRNLLGQPNRKLSQANTLKIGNFYYKLLSSFK